MLNTLLDPSSRQIDAVHTNKQASRPMISISAIIGLLRDMLVHPVPDLLLG